jgi:hypothetical protein
MSAVGGQSIDKREADGPMRAGSIEDEEEEIKAAGGGFLSLVKGNNLTLNDYLQMMNTGLYNEYEETEENDTEIEEYKNRINGSGDDGDLSDDSADQFMNKEEQENLF